MTEQTKVVVIGAHPDEADLYAGGTAALFASQGCSVTFLSLTNGDAGHYELGREALAARRASEAAAAARQLGVRAYDILDVHDGELFPTLELRREVIRRIRWWGADVVITFHHEGGGHPDNRAAGQVVRGAAAFVTLRNIVPDVPALARRPVCLYMVDYATRERHRPDLAIDIDDAIERKLLACDAHATQFHEAVPRSRGLSSRGGDAWPERRAFILQHWAAFMDAPPEASAALARWYGPDRAKAVRFAEVFQVAEYGRQPTDDDLRGLFPMLPCKEREVC